jgi:hypothetical protein
MVFACALAATPRIVYADPPSFLDRAVVAEATRLAIERIGLDPSSARSLATRARHAAWLPQVSLRVVRATGAATTQFTQQTSDRQLVDDSLMFDVRVTLALDRLVFDAHEVALFSAESTRAERRQHVEASVLDALARLEQLRRTRAAMGAPDVTSELEWLRARARVEQLTGAPLEAISTLRQR